MNMNLRELYLADNKLNGLQDSAQLGNLLKFNCYIQILDLRNNHVLDSGEGAHMLLRLPGASHRAGGLGWGTPASPRAPQRTHARPAPRRLGDPSRVSPARSGATPTTRPGPTPRCKQELAVAGCWRTRRAGARRARLAVGVPTGGFPAASEGLGLGLALINPRGLMATRGHQRRGDGVSGTAGRAGD